MFDYTIMVAHKEAKSASLVAQLAEKVWSVSPLDNYRHRRTDSPGTHFRHRPDSVCINTPTAYRSIYGPRGNVKKSNIYKVWPRTADYLNTWNDTSIESQAHKRRVLNYAFSDMALRSAEPFIHKNVDRWIDLLSQQKAQSQNRKKSINMADQVTYLVFDILGDLCFGKCFDMKEPGSKLRYVIDMMLGFIETMHPV